MKTFTFYYDRFDTATTSIALKEKNIDHIILCHSEDAKNKFINSGVAKGEIISTENPKGLAYQRNYALGMMQVGEWAVFMSDDYVKTKKANYKKIGQVLDTRNKDFKFKDAGINDVYESLDVLIPLAEKNNIHLIGFGFNTNPMFVSKPYATKGLADGRCFAVKKSNLKFDEKIHLIDDMFWTALNIKTFGSVLVFNYIVPEFKRYTPGGCGTIAERAKQKAIECQYIQDMFYPMVRIVNKPGQPMGTHLKLFAR